MQVAIQKFLRCKTGASAIEFALVAPVLFFFVMAIIEMGLVLYTQIAVEAAVANVARTNIVGSAGGFPDRVSYIKAELTRQTAELINGSNVVISSDVVNTGPSSYVAPELCLTAPPRFGPNCPLGTPFEDTNGNGVYDTGNMPSNFGAGGDLVEINVALPWSFFTPIIGRFFGTRDVVEQSTLYGTYIIRSSAVIKNEPF